VYRELIGLASGQPEASWPASTSGIDDVAKRQFSLRGSKKSSDVLRSEDLLLRGSSKSSEMLRSEDPSMPIGAEGYERRVAASYQMTKAHMYHNPQVSQTRGALKSPRKRSQANYGASSASTIHRRSGGRK
jgi:hypothetical protein